MYTPLRFALAPCLLLLTLTATAVSSAEQPDIKAVMHSFLGSMQALRPEMLSKDEFSAPANKEVVLEKLKEFSARVDEGKPFEVKKSVGFSVTYDLLGRHVREIDHLYRAGATDAAWQRLNATAQFCVGCHTRLPRPVRMEAYQWAGRGEKPVEGTVKDAEFLFLAHQYPAALDLMNRLIRNHENPKEAGDLSALFERKIAFYARIQRDPAAAIKSLREDLKSKNLPERYRADLQTWIKGFESLQKATKSFPKSPKDPQLLAKAKAILGADTSERRLALGDSQTIPTLWISGLLYERVYAGKDSPDMAEFLYWLARAERNLESVRIYSLADVYLMKCVELYPKQPIARSCFRDYSVSLKQKYRVVPEAVQNSIDALGRQLE